MYVTFKIQMNKKRLKIKLFTLKNVIYCLVDYIIKKFSKKLIFEKNVLEATSYLESEGVFISELLIDKFWCEILRNEIDKNLASNNVLVWTGFLQADKRIFGMEKFSTIAQEILENRIIEVSLNLYKGQKHSHRFNMAARISFAEGNLGSGEGWHRDWSDYHQAKSITYLSEVDSNSGPFEYITKSHNIKSILRDWVKYRISPFSWQINEIKVNKIIQNEPHRYIKVLGPPGLTLLADMRGIHRGRPLGKNCSRYAITNYYFYRKIPDFLIRILN